MTQKTNERARFEEIYKRDCERMARRSDVVLVETQEQVFMDGEQIGFGKNRWHKAWLCMKGLADYGWAAKRIYN